MSSGLHRVVFDTNVLASAACFGGRPAELLGLASTGWVKGVVSRFILEELRTVLVRSRLGLDERRASEFAAEIARIMDVVETGPPRGNWATDPDDDPVIETSLAGRATVIVSGDRRLLAAQVPGIEILKVADLLARLTRRP